MSHNIKIENFEGPFDLLLHLIKINEMDIYNIQINEITEQYLDFLKQMKYMDLEVTSEFIVIAATLLEIKSRTLLPKYKEVENENPEDSSQKLLTKLIEYKKFKEISEYLKSREEDIGQFFSKKPEIIEDKDYVNKSIDLFENITILNLYEIYLMLVERYESKQNNDINLGKNIKLDMFKIEDKMMELTERINLEKRINFSIIIDSCKNKLEAVVTFLALLELIKIRSVNVIQYSSFDEIYVEGIENNNE
jgi:segregation and condensation protein A